MSQASAAIQIESAESDTTQTIALHIVIKLMQQFLIENRMYATVRTLAEESGVTANFIESTAAFESAVIEGKWESVLESIQTLTLPTALMHTLMEQIFNELIESKEFEAARSLLRNVPIFVSLKKDSPDRYLLLEHLLNRVSSSGNFDANQVYGAAGKDAKRKDLAASLVSHVQVVQPSRLLTLLSQSMKYQQLQGLLPVSKSAATAASSKYDLFRGCSVQESVSQAVEAYPTRNSKVIKFTAGGGKSYPESVRFSPDGAWIVSGSSDGYIEIWEADTGKLATSAFAYQAEDQLMSHDDAVLAIAFSLNMELLATGSGKGEIKVWRLATGSCVRKFVAAHSEGITGLEFMRDSSSLISSSFDSLLKMHGLKSGRTLKEFRGHTSFVLGFCVVDATVGSAGEKAERLLSASADGTVRVWDTKTCDCLRVIQLHAATPGAPAPSLLGIQVLPTNPDHFVVVERSGTLRIIDSEGKVVHAFQSTTAAAPGSAAASSKAAGPLATAAAKKKGLETSSASLGDFVAITLSPKGKFLYAVTEECVLHCFDVIESKLVHAIKVHKTEIVGVAHHPHRNLLATFSQEGNIKLWLP